MKNYLAWYIQDDSRGVEGLLPETARRIAKKF
jgi:hypothetical protein